MIAATLVQAPAEFSISVGDVPGEADLALGVSRESCWSTVLGEFALPDTRALDELAAAADAWPSLPRKVMMTGHPAAALLPVLWLRTIWLGPDARIELHWPRVTTPGADGREQFAASLCRSLVNSMSSSDDAMAASKWGISVGEAPLGGQELLDNLVGLIDAWDIEHRGVARQQPVEWMMRARAAIERCADTGRKRIAIYGAGTHTREIGPILMEPRVEIACIIDDHTAGQGRRLWGFPVVSRERAIAMGVEAVILSANSIEDKLWANCGIFRDAGIEVIRLYGGEESSNESHVILRADAVKGDEQGALLVFPAIYSRNAWGDGESKSGPGSSLAQTESIRAALPPLLKRLEIRSLLDAPCGDLNWMKTLLPLFDRYTGVDIVPAVIAHNQSAHSSESRSFTLGNIISDPPPTADAVLCRDGLVHLSFADALSAIANFRRSGARYFIATTFPGLGSGNIDIETGGWRPLDLQHAPFSFPAPISLIDENCPDHALKHLAVWRMEDLSCLGALE